MCVGFETAASVCDGRNVEEVSVKSTSAIAVYKVVVQVCAFDSRCYKANTASSFIAAKNNNLPALLPAS